MQPGNGHTKATGKMSHQRQKRVMCRRVHPDRAMQCSVVWVDGEESPLWTENGDHDWQVIKDTMELCDRNDVEGTKTCQ